MSKGSGIYKSVFEFSGEGIAVLRDDIIQMVNPRAAEILGYSQCKILKRPFSDFIYHADRKGFPKGQGKSMDRNMPYTHIFRLVGNNKNTIHCESRAVMIKWRGKDSLLVIFRDISDRVEFSGTLHEKNETLRRIFSEFENEKRSTAREVQTSIDKIIMPILYNIEANIDPANRHYYKLLVSSLKNITSPYITRLEVQFSQLTPRELQLCMMVKNGLSSKQIASALNKSPETIKKQRKTIRKKLGIEREKVNMASFLNRLI